jgi:hypothetical protein
MQFLLNIVRNVELRGYCRSQGLSKSETRAMVAGCKEEHLQQAAAMAKVEIPVELTNPPVGGDVVGSGFLQKIMDWLKSPNGQAFIKMLFSLLIALLPLLL